MTLGDSVALVAGVAASLAVVAGLPRALVMSPVVALATFAIRGFQGLALSIAMAALGRVGVYRRMPTAAEWLTILFGVTILGECPWFQVDSWLYAYRWAFPPLDPLDPAGARWLGAGLFSVAIAIGLGGLRLSRAALPAWVKTLGLAWLGLLAMSGPLLVFSEQGADLFSPSEGFGPGVGPILLHRACMMLAGLPTGLFLGLPAVAALGERIGGRRWSWVEWSGAATSALFGVVGLVAYRAQGEFAAGSPAWAVERVMLLAWVLVVVLIDRWLLIHSGESWRRWVEGPGGRDQDSAASTR